MNFISHIYICIYTYIHRCVYLHVCIYPNMVCIHTAHMCMHVRMRGCVHKPAYKYIHTHILEKDPSCALYMVSTRKMIVTTVSDLIELFLKNHLLQLL